MVGLSRENRCWSRYGVVRDGLVDIDQKSRIRVMICAWERDAGWGLGTIAGNIELETRHV